MAAYATIARKPLIQEQNLIFGFTIAMAKNPNRLRGNGFASADGLLGGPRKRFVRLANLLLCLGLGVRRIRAFAREQITRQSVSFPGAKFEIDRAPDG